MHSIFDNTVVAGVVTISHTQSLIMVATGPSVDTRGYSTGALRVRIGTIGPAALSAVQLSSVTSVLQESSDNVTFTTATDNTGATIGNALVVATTTAVVSDARIEGLGLQRKRYLRVQLTSNVASLAIGGAGAFTTVALIELGRGYTKVPSGNATSNT